MANTAGPFGKPGPDAIHARTCAYKVNHRAEDCPLRRSDPSTAQTLGAYFRELKEQGIDPDSATQMVIEAARKILNDEPLMVGQEIPESMTLLRIAIPVDKAKVRDKALIEQVASEAALRAVEAVLS